MSSSAMPVPVTGFERRFGHPPGLVVLFFAEMWERFSYYGMRGLLKLYMVNYLFVTTRQLLQGGDEQVAGDPSHVLGWGLIQPLAVGFGGADIQGQASVIYGWYTGLVYLTPFFGGIVADRWLGQRRTVYVGGLLMAAGHFVMAFENWFFIALTLLIIGNGAFKPNISTQVGRLYADGDPRRDGAFTIFYMGINLGAFICNFICGTLAAVYGWHYGFAAAGVGMCLGLVVYAWGQRFLAPDTLNAAVTDTSNEPAGPLTSGEWRRVWALVALCALNIVFWAVYEQQGNTMQTWADEQTAWPTILGFQVPSTWFQSWNPLCIFLFAPFLDQFWRWQNKRGGEPTSVTKMAIGCYLLGISFVLMVIGAQFVGDGEKGSMFWPLACTLLLTIGELYLSPIGLSLVTKVSPARIVSMMMGMWFVSSFFGNTLSGIIGTLYTQIPKEAFFGLLMALGIGAGVAISLFNRPIQKAIAHEDPKPA
ncbi:MAG: peptide MFS transporter [Myxococcota bacterium]